MARSRRTRTSRALITFVVLSVALGSAIQFHRLKKANAAAIKPVPAPAPIVAAAAPDSSSKPATPADPKADAMAMLAAVHSAVQPALASVLMAPTTRPADSLTPSIWQAPQTPAPVMPKVQTVSVSPSSNTPLPPAILTPAAPAAASAPAQPVNHLAQTIADAKIKSDTGDLVAARKTLNDSLLAGTLTGADADSVRKQISTINQTVVFSSKHFADDSFGGNYTVKPGEKLSTIAAQHDVTWELLLRLNNMSDPRRLRASQSLKLIKGPFHAVVTKSKFTMDIYLGSAGEAGSMYVTTFPVGLGRDDSTPTGAWVIEPHHKIKHPTYYSPRGEGVIAADDPKNPLGPFWLGLTGTDGHAVGRLSYGIHGTIDPDSIGKMASLGCIRMQNTDVALVYELLVEGKSTVIVRD